MEVFLTFDDGIHAGTAEVLTVLEKMKISATFFLVGKEMDSMYKWDPKKFLDTLKKIAEGHSIGNHSYSHTDEKYKDYYENDGVLSSSDGTRMSVEEDFDQGSSSIQDYLQLIYGDGYGKKIAGVGTKQEKLLARLPGRNTSYFSTGKNTVLNPPYIKCEPNTKKYSEQLFLKGYNVFGWNVEWNMSFDFHLNAAEQMAGKKTISPAEMYLKENRYKDRLLNDWSVVMDNIHRIVEKQQKVVLLMHDRAFRSTDLKESQKDLSISNTGFDPLNAETELEMLIGALIAQGAIFKTLDHFF